MPKHSDTEYQFQFLKIKPNHGNWHWWFYLFFITCGKTCQNIVICQTPKFVIDFCLSWVKNKIGPGMIPDIDNGYCSWQHVKTYNVHYFLTFAINCRWESSPWERGEEQLTRSLLNWLHCSRISWRHRETLKVKVKMIKQRDIHNHIMSKLSSIYIF